MSTYFPKVRNNSHSFLQVQKNAYLLPESPEKIHSNPMVGRKSSQPVWLLAFPVFLFVTNIRKLSDECTTFVF